MNTTTALAAIGFSLATVGISNAAVIAGTTATTSSEYGGGVELSTDLVDAADLNASNEHLSSAFGGGTNWLSSNGSLAADQWVYIDLGAEYDLSEVQIWNYNSSSTGAGEVSRRGVDDYELFVGVTGATLPVAASSTAFVLAGWSSVASGNLVKGPDSDPNSPGTAYALDAGNTISVTNTSVRYIGIQIGSRQGPDPYTANSVGLGQIQVISVPEPSSSALLGLGGLALILRRRK